MTEHWQPVAGPAVLRSRARMLQNIRAFFTHRGVLEVETPILSSAATTDPNLSSFATRYRQQSLYLNTSPEYSMKRMLAAHGDAIYQVCKAFRDDESGPRHNPEFTLLEWYRPGFDMFALMDELGDLVGELARSHGIEVAGSDRISYGDAFQQAAGLDPHAASSAQCRDCAIAHGIEVPVGLDDDVDGWLDWLLTQLVMPSFAKNRFTYLYAYPRSQASLASLYRDDQGNTVAARFELFYGETELANGFDELQDAGEQRRRFEQENRTRHLAGLPAASIDEYLLQALEHGLPACSGVALGLDRLLMLLLGASTIEQVLAFPFSRI